MKYIHRDQLNQILEADDVVAFAHNNHLKIGFVKRINPKMISVLPLNIEKNSGYQAKRARLPRKYPTDLVKLIGPAVTLYLLSNKGS